jgi:hypothetical protein
LRSSGADVRRLAALAALLVLFAADKAAAAAAEPQSCASRVQGFIRQYAKPQTTLVLTFTGAQNAVLPLAEAASGPSAEVNLFPIDRTLFVLTIEIHVVKPNLDTPIFKPWTSTICDLAEGHGARYNGAIAYSGNHMIGADMSLPQQ